MRGQKIKLEDVRVFLFLLTTAGEFCMKRATKLISSSVSTQATAAAADNRTGNVVPEHATILSSSTVKIHLASYIGIHITR